MYLSTKKSWARGALMTLPKATLTEPPSSLLIAVSSFPNGPCNLSITILMKLPLVSYFFNISISSKLAYQSPLIIFISNAGALYMYLIFSPIQRFAITIKQLVLTAKIQKCYINKTNSLWGDDDINNNIHSKGKS